MRLLSLDYDPVYGESTTRESFSGDISAFDFDVVIWDPARTLPSYVHWNRRYRGLYDLTEDDSVRIQADCLRRRTEFEELVKSGRVLVVITRPPQMCYVDTGNRNYSGTGRNRQETRLVNQFDLLSALPVSDCKFSVARGDRIDIVGDGPIPDLLRKYKGFLEYTAILSGDGGSPTARIAGTNRVVASTYRGDPDGYILFLPALNFISDTPPSGDEEDGVEDEDDEHSDTRSFAEEAPEFQEDLLLAIQQLSKAKSASRPVWIENYATPEQQRLRSEIVKQRERVERARMKLTKLQGESERAEERDQLFLGTGRALEVEVKKAFEQLGGRVTEPEPGRDDWRISFPEGDAVAEVKGVGKSAAEKHAAQLEKWVSLAYEETGELRKGFLVVNTWRNLPLADRIEADFPEQMIPYSKSRGHCLLTGLDLFCILDEVEKKPSRAGHWRRTLLETVGRIEERLDWRTAIVETTDQPGA